MSTTRKQQQGGASQRLAKPADRGSSQKSAGPQPILWPESWDQLQEAALAVLREETGIPSLQADESGDIGIRYGSALVWVRVNRTMPDIGVFSRVLEGVEANPPLLVALNDLNTHRRPATFYTWDSTVMLATEVDCEPFHGPALIRAVRFVARLADDMGPFLAACFGGKTAYQESKEPEDEHTTAELAN